MRKFLIIFLLLFISCSQKEYVDYKCDFNDILIRYYNDGRLDYSDKFNNVNAFQIVNNDKLLSFKIINVNNKLFQFLIDKKENLKFWIKLYDPIFKSWNDFEDIGKCKQI